MGLSVNILTSGFLVTVVVFFLLMGILFYSSYTKMGQVLLENDSTRNDLSQLDSALSNIKWAYIFAFIGTGLALLLAVLYAGHETVISPSEYWHLGLYVLTFIAWLISVVYAGMALNKLYNTRITERNGADAYIWAGLLMAIFVFVGLVATGSGRLGMNAVRSTARDRLEAVENKIHTHLPAIHEHVAATHANIEAHLPTMHHKVAEIHQASGLSVPAVVETQYVQSHYMPSQVASPQVVSALASPQVVSTLASQYVSQVPASPQYVSQIPQPSGLLLPQTFSAVPCNQAVQTVRRI